mgnify:CR=1 FL=1
MLLCKIRSRSDFELPQDVDEPRLGRDRIGIAGQDARTKLSIIRESDAVSGATVEKRSEALDRRAILMEPQCNALEDVIEILRGEAA